MEAIDCEEKQSRSFCLLKGVLSESKEGLSRARGFALLL